MSTPSVPAADGPHQARTPIRRALISVSDKSGLAELARGLHAAGVALVSTGTTAAMIAEAGVPVQLVADLTGFPECLDGRVKTLHPRVHAGVLADVRLAAHRAQLDELGIEAFELVVVNLYPFADTVASGAQPDGCVEQIDIGGPAMVRAAAKNFANVAVVTSPSAYPEVLAAVADGGFTVTRRRELAALAFAHTASYDIAVASWFANVLAPDQAGFPTWLGASWDRAAVLRYGENPHQRAALYTGHDHRPGLARAEQLHGKEMSYNNYVDADAARRAAFDHQAPAVAIIKHANPCGIAVAETIEQAYAKAFDTDPVSAYGGVVATNRPLDAATAAAMKDVFTEVVVAPDYEPAALEILQAKKNVRLLRVAGPHPGRRIESRSISGGVLLQSVDDIEAFGDDPADWTLACGDPANPATLTDLEFAWRAVRSAKSNAILLARDTAAVGVGMGQVNRVDAARLAVARAGEERCRGAVAASDAFFPFPDGLEVLLAAGIRAIVQPGGSVRDAEVIAAAQAAGATLYLTGTRHFFH